MKTLTFVPSGGLANRMRAIASAMNLYRHTGREVDVVWFRDWGLNARFCDIFEPLHLAGLTIREGHWWHELTVARPRKRNLCISRLYQHLVYSKGINEVTVTPLKQQHFDFDAWAATADKRIYMSSYQVFGTFEDYDALIRELFVPVPVIRKKIEQNTSRLSSHSIGLHIRRTDNAESIQCSPIEKFLEIADREIAANESTMIYLATDDEPTKNAFRSRYGQRIVTPDVPASRGSLDGIMDGIVDMWTLAATDVIYGSKGSSFSPMAASIGGKKLVIVE